MPFNPSTAAKIDTAASGAAGAGSAVKNSVQATALLNREANKLRDFIQQRIDAYYQSYTPKLYKRTYNFKNNTLKVSSVKIENGRHTIHVYFDPNTSVYDGTPDYVPNNPHGFVPLLIDSGWQVGDGVPFKNVEHFGHQDGFDIIQHAVSEYNAINKHGIKVDLNWGYGK